MDNYIINITFLFALFLSLGDIVSYLAGMLHDSGLDDVEESIGPFLEGYGCDDELVKACGAAVMNCAKNGNENGGDGGIGGINSSQTVTNGSGNGHTNQGAVKLKQGIVSMSSALSGQSEAEIDANRYMWGQDK